jgi:antitoxin component of RelBE/YafQ-DinJ toxin-antitoxin module
MSIDVPLRDHKRIKMLAAAEGASIREFVIECIRERIYPEKIPNKKTLKAMEDVRQGKVKKAKDFDDLCNQLGV